MAQKILLITTSSGLPRLYPEYVAFEDTWTAKLRSKGDVLQLSLGGYAVDTIFSLIHYYVHFQPDIVISQVGLADAAVRPLTRIENRILDTTSITRKFKKWLLKNYIVQLRKRRRITNLKIDKFEYFFKKIVHSFPEAEFYALSISNPNDQHEERSPGIKKNVDNYNEVMKKVVGENYFIDLLDMPVNGLMKDMHINTIGHKYIVECIESRIFNKTEPASLANVK